MSVSMRTKAYVLCAASFLTGAFIDKTPPGLVGDLLYVAYGVATSLAIEFWLVRE
jgi:hypothetical protein